MRYLNRYLCKVDGTLTIRSCLDYVQPAQPVRQTRIEQDGSVVAMLEIDCQFVDLVGVSTWAYRILVRYIALLALE